MAYRQEELVSEIITQSGVLHGRRPQHPGKRAHRPSNVSQQVGSAT